MNTTDTLVDRSTTPINIPFIQAERPHLRITVGACRLKIMPAEGPEWVTGSYDDPSRALPLSVTQEGSTITISQTRDFVEMIRLLEGPPVLKLALGTAAPYTLTLETGASECQIDLGGLPLLGLVVKQGAGKVHLEFSRPNPTEMGVFSIGAGASGVEMRGLAHANFDELIVEGGAASYLLDFGGTLRRNASVSISAAMAGVDFYVPATTAARVTCTALMGGVVAGSGFIRHGETYYTRPTRVPSSEEGHPVPDGNPVLNVQARITMGGLNLHTT
jgi:hypothetical protein